MVLMPEYADQVIPLALLGRELGVDYTVIKHCSDDEKGRLGVDYDWYKTPIAVELLKTAEAISTKNYSVQAKWSKMMTGRDRKYSKCFGPPLFLQMSGTGIVAPCGSFFHSRYNQYHIGDIKEQNFYDIWNSSKYDQVMEYISSDKFEAKKQCATLCLQDKVNEVLNDLVENNILLDDVHQKKQPDHINFI
jgi:MoaA/NifB/PqqE/SkfB family radical SAM enzyme